ncbi:hypothetical protein JCM3774_004994 [Rhodotorula dairenensis]
MPTNKSTKHANKRTMTTVPETSSSTTTALTPKSTAPMMQYTNLEFPMQQSALSKYDESAADLSAYLDFSSYATPSSAAPPLHQHHEHQHQLPPSFEHAAFAAPLRPVDDSLLDSPLDLELSPASTTYDSSSSSCFSSPFLVDDHLAGSVSPVVLADFDFGGGSDASSTTSLFAPAPSLTTLMTGHSSGGAAGTEIDMVALATSLGVTLPPLSAPPPSFSTSAAPSWTDTPSVQSSEPVSIPTLPFIREEEDEGEDVKPRVVDLLVVGAEADANATVTVTSATTAGGSSSSSKKRKASPASSSPPPSSAAAVDDATACPKRDKFTGIRNTKKPPVAYDAPTLPKNYYTESATSKKRGSSSSSSSSAGSASSHKRARSAVSVTPEAVAVALPSAQPDPIPEDEFDESQLSAIELKRRQNTLAARRSRARKSAYIQELKDEIDALKQLNEQLQRQVEAAQGRCQSCGGGGGGAVAS